MQLFGRHKLVPAHRGGQVETLLKPFFGFTTGMDR